MYLIVTGGTENFRYQGRADICATGSEAPQRFNYSTSDMGAEYCGERVCVCLSTIIPSELHVCDCLVVYIISYHIISEIYSAPITKRTWTMAALQKSAKC